MRGFFFRKYLKGFSQSPGNTGDGRVVRSLCRGVLLIRIEVGQEPTALAVGAGGVIWPFSLVYLFSFLSPSLGGGPI